jgi:hypothetical protein
MGEAGAGTAAAINWTHALEQLILR